MELIYMYIKNYSNMPLRKIEKLDNKRFREFCIQDQGITFGDRFECSFVKTSDSTKGKLIIKDNRSKIPYNNFYGENTISITSFVGENGTGKTTLLDLIGMPRDNRFNVHRIREKQRGFKISSTLVKSKDLAEYFFVYHFQDSNSNEDYFILETYSNFFGHNDCWISNIDSAFFGNGNGRGNAFYKDGMAIIGKYNFDTDAFEMSMETHLFDQKNKREKYFESNEILYYSCKHSNRIKGTMKSIKHEDCQGYMFPRKIVAFDKHEPAFYREVIDFLYSEKMEIMRANIIDSKLAITLTDRYDDAFIEIDDSYELGVNEALRTLEKDFFKHPFKTLENEKATFLLALLRKYMVTMINELLRGRGNIQVQQNQKVKMNILDDEYLKGITGSAIGYKKLKDEETNKSILEELEMIIKVKDFIKRNIKNDIEYEYFNSRSDFREMILLSRYIFSRVCIKHKLREAIYHESFEMLIDKMAKIDSEYFTKDTIIVDSESYSEDTICQVKSLIDFMQHSFENSIDTGNDIANRFQIELPYGSDGELVLIDIVCKIISCIDRSINDKTYIIVLDEPDQRLHPEWSRQFISLLTSALRQINGYFVAKGSTTRFTFQIVLSTHSPYMLSDIRSNDIFIIEKNTKNLESPNSISIKKAQIHTFGANIYDVLKNSFMLKQTLGQFTMEKIEQDLGFLKLDDNAFVKKAKEIDFKKAEYLIGIIGDSLMQKMLEEAYREKVSVLNELNKTESSPNDILVGNLLKRYFELNPDLQKEFVDSLIKQSKGGRD